MWGRSFRRVMCLRLFQISWLHVITPTSSQRQRRSCWSCFPRPGVTLWVCTGLLERENAKGTAGVWAAATWSAVSMKRERNPRNSSLFTEPLLNPVQGAGHCGKRCFFPYCRLNDSGPIFGDSYHSQPHGRGIQAIRQRSTPRRPPQLAQCSVVVILKFGRGPHQVHSLP